LFSYGTFLGPNWQKSRCQFGHGYDISELKQVTFLTTRTAWVTSEDWVKGCDWWKTSILLPVDVRAVKNVTCLSSLFTGVITWWRKTMAYPNKRIS
jgi:hypothetical protein